MDIGKMKGRRKRKLIIMKSRYPVGVEIVDKQVFVMDFTVMNFIVCTVHLK